MSKLTDLMISEAGDLLARKEISPVELTQAHLERIEKLDPLLNCFITRTPEAALQRARRAEDELLRGERKVPLHGIPFGLKDLYETRGVRTTCGSLFWADYIPEADASVVEKIYQAGAVNLGKLNMHEIALGLTNVNPHYGACRNPWDLDRVPGGSSGGSAAALAAGLCLASLGSDTGGSIRVPAALCGVVGLKPTYGRVSLRGVFPLSWNLDHAGPMARSVRDVAILLQVIAGYDPADPVSVNAPVDDYQEGLEKGVAGWNIALADDQYVEANTAPEVLEAVHQAARVFEDQGARVSRITLPGFLEAAKANGLMVVSDAAAVHRERLAQQPEKFGADIRQRLETGKAYSSTEYILARQAQVELRRAFERIFNDYDILLTPATPMPAPPIQGQDALEQARLLTRFTAPFNLTGLPAISVPCGFTHQGLPIGLQIVAAPWAEAAILQAAHAFEQGTDWHRRRPVLPMV